MPTRSPSPSGSPTVPTPLKWCCDTPNSGHDQHGLCDGNHWYLCPHPTPTYYYPTPPYYYPSNNYTNHTGLSGAAITGMVIVALVPIIASIGYFIFRAKNNNSGGHNHEAVSVFPSNGMNNHGGGGIEQPQAAYPVFPMKSDTMNVKPIVPDLPTAPIQIASQGVVEQDIEVQAALALNVVVPTTGHTSIFDQLKESNAKK